jgi:hypothetical protein
LRFSVGVNYWPRHFDAGEVREDFARIAALGLDTVRFFLRWDEPQLSLDDVASIVDIAAAAGLRTLPTLTCAPGIGNIYDGALLATQVAFVQTAGERMRAHPAIAAWDIGNAFTSVSPPARGKMTSGEHASEPVAEPVVAAWCRRLTATLRAAAALPAAALPATAGTTSDDLENDNNMRFASLCAPLAFASMQGSNASLGFARDRLDPETLPFLAMLTAAFSYKPVLVTGFGNPPSPHYTDDENAAYCTAVLERLHADGRLGAYWWRWGDDAEKPVAAALGAFARQAREVVKPSDMPMISSTYYYRTLPESVRTLFDAFLAFVADRREPR